jgi:flagellar biosynthesis/type III secretory pathway protein FliH
MRSARVEGEPVVITYPSPQRPDRLPPLAALGLQPAPQVTLPEPAAPQEDAGVTLEALRRQAFDDGYRDGRERGEKDARAELAAELQGVQALARSVPEALAQGIEGVEDVMVEIAFAAVCKVLGPAAASEEGVRGMVREAMSEVRSKEGVVLRVSPRDHALLQAQFAVELNLDVVADERVAAGGCLIETTGGTLDARLEIQLRRLADTLTRARQAQGEVEGS